MSGLRVFGLRAEVGRWGLVAAGLVMMICLGAIYAYSVIRVPVEEIFKSPPPKGYGLKVTSTEMQLPYIVFLLLFALTMPFAGKYIEKYGPRVVALIGALLVSLAWFLASFASSPLALVLLYGVVGGLGVGIAYNCPITVSAKWFPDKRGLAVGLTVLGFGVSAALIGPLADLLTAMFGVQTMFRILGIVFLALMISSALLLRFPPNGWSPVGWKPSRSRDASGLDLSIREAIRTSTFYALWTCYTIGTLAGLMAIGFSKQVGFEVAENARINIEEISPILTTLITFFAVCNGLGRPLFGWITDKLAPKRTAVLSFSLIFAASLAILVMPSSIPVYIFAFSVLWLNLGGWLAIAPAATAQFFGMSNYARNYGLIFTAYGA
ncbi:MAG: OFA family MFS transporter, partial [Candidatus Bathyarchaeota archaeon]|nr:OFA family MFS transporter [Candidatus Bathyarchaeota archaeon]